MRGAPSLDAAIEAGKPRLLYMLFCDWYSQTREQKSNFMGVFDSMTVGPQETHARNFWLCFRTLGTMGEGLQIVVYSPENVPIAQLKFAGTPDPDSPPGTPRYFDGAIQGSIPIAAAGLYWFAAFFKEELLGGNGFRIIRRVSDEDGGTHGDAGNP